MKLVLCVLITLALVAPTVLGSTEDSKDRFELFKDNAGKFRFRIRSGGNNEIILASQGYTSLQGAQRGMTSCLINGKNLRNIKSSGNGKRSFNIVAANGKVVGTSEQYSSKAAMEKGREGVQNAVENILAQLVPTKDGKNSGAGFSIIKGTGKQPWRFILKAPNGEVLIHSEHYANRHGAMAGIISVIANGMGAAKWTSKTSSNKQKYNILKAANGEIIAQSETLKGDPKRNIKSVRKTLSKLILKILPVKTTGVSTGRPTSSSQSRQTRPSTSSSQSRQTRTQGIRSQTTKPRTQKPSSQSLQKLKKKIKKIAFVEEDDDMDAFLQLEHF